MSAASWEDDLDPKKDANAGSVGLCMLIPPPSDDAVAPVSGGCVGLLLGNPGFDTDGGSGRVSILFLAATSAPWGLGIGRRAGIDIGASISFMTPL